MKIIGLILSTLCVVFVLVGHSNYRRLENIILSYDSRWPDVPILNGTGEFQHYKLAKAAEAVLLEQQLSHFAYDFRRPFGLVELLVLCLGGVGGTMLAYLRLKDMQDRMENDPDKRKLKELNALLRRETAAKVLEGGIDLENEGDSIRFRFDNTKDGPQ